MKYKYKVGDGIFILLKYIPKIVYDEIWSLEWIEEDRIYYRTKGLYTGSKDIFEEKQLFTSREELINSL